MKKYIIEYAWLDNLSNTVRNESMVVNSVDKSRAVKFFKRYSGDPEGAFYRITFVDEILQS